VVGGWVGSAGWGAGGVSIPGADPGGLSAALSLLSRSRARAGWVGRARRALALALGQGGSGGRGGVGRSAGWGRRAALRRRRAVPPWRGGGSGLLGGARAGVSIPGADPGGLSALSLRALALALGQGGSGGRGGVGRVCWVGAQGGASSATSRAAVCSRGARTALRSCQKTLFHRCQH
jgi:hypothetical protein